MRVKILISKENVETFAYKEIETVTPIEKVKHSLSPPIENTETPSHKKSRQNFADKKNFAHIKYRNTFVHRKSRITPAHKKKNQKFFHPYKM